MSRVIAEIPGPDDRCDVRELLRVADDLIADVERYVARVIEIEALRGPGRELAQSVWESDLMVRLEALSSRMEVLVGALRYVGLLPQELGLIDENVGLGKVPRMKTLKFLRGVLELRVAEGEAYRPAGNAWRAKMRAQIEARRSTRNAEVHEA